MAVTIYSSSPTAGVGSTGTGLDQWVELIGTDPSLAGNGDAVAIAAGGQAADALNHLILAAARAVGADADGVFTAAEVVAMNAWIRADAQRLAEWTRLHGDDHDVGDVREESGFHLVQNNRAGTSYRGDNLIDTVIDGVYHLGFEIRDGAFVNEDGTANATVQQVADWLTQFHVDRATTGTRLDQIPTLIQADWRLAVFNTWADIAAGQAAADALNHLILDGLKALGVTLGGTITPADVVALNAWIRADAGRLARFVALHGDDEDGEETGYHRVQNDGSSTPRFGRSLIDTVADGIYHIGFEIRDGVFLNEDGDANATVADVASWLTAFLSDRSTTGTGLDRIVDVIQTDLWLGAGTSVEDLDAGAQAANALNHLLIEAMRATGAMADGWILPADLVAMNAWVRGDATRLQTFLALHGDDENGEETGFHRVQNDGNTTTAFHNDLVDTIADGLYHFGFEIRDGRFVNEDGDANARLTDAARWLNYFYKGARLVDGGQGWDTLVLPGSAGPDEIIGHPGADIVDAGDGADLIWGYAGDDTIRAGAGDDQIHAGSGNDVIDGGEGSDLYVVNPDLPEGWSGSYDLYADTGTTGVDVLVTQGAGDVDVALRDWVNTGIERIDASGAGGITRLVGWNHDNVLDFRATTLIGRIVIDGGFGSDTIYGSAGADVLVGNWGNDRLVGGAGGDLYRFGMGSGTDRVVEAAVAPGDLDTLSFEDGVTVEQLRFRRIDADLEIRLDPSDTAVTVEGWYGSAPASIERIVVTAGGGRTLDAAQVDSLVQQMAALEAQGLTGPAFEVARSQVIAAHWH